jgi:nucleotide-binding universal stress UspA family protein
MGTEKNDIVVVASDFSEFAECAVEHAIGIAKLLNYKLYVVHIWNKKKAKYSISEAEEKLKLIISDIKEKEKIECYFIVREGNIFTTIGEIAIELGANILTMGTRGKTGVQYIFGSYALKVVQSSPVPVIVVQTGKYRGSYSNVVIPIDESVYSKQKVKWAFWVAKKFKSKIHIFGKYDTDEFIARKISNNCYQIKKIFDQNDIDYSYTISDGKGGNYSKQTIAFASKIDADMILIMTSPDTLLPGFIIDAHDEQIILNAAQIPIMCINPLDLDIKIVGL